MKKESVSAEKVEVFDQVLVGQSYNYRVHKALTSAKGRDEFRKIYGHDLKRENPTQQQFRNEVNINSIMKRYRQNGILPANVRQPIFGNFAGADDFIDIQNRFLNAVEAFDQLPGSIRERFGGSIPALLQFLADPKNRKEAITLGLVEDKTPPPPKMGDKVHSDDKQSPPPPADGKK